MYCVRYYSSATALQSLTISLFIFSLCAQEIELSIFITRSYTHKFIYTLWVLCDILYICIYVFIFVVIAAIGFKKAKWSVFDLNKRACVFSQLEGTEQIECIQYSPDGKYLACGSRDNSIYIYAVSEEGYRYLRVGRCYGHSSFITHIDWSVNSDFLMSNSGDYEVLIWNAGTCKQVTQVQLIRELSFHTNSCTISFNTLGRC